MLVCLCVFFSAVVCVWVNCLCVCVCVCVFGEELSRNDKEKTTDEAKSNKEEP